MINSLLLSSDPLLTRISIISKTKTKPFVKKTMKILLTAEPLYMDPYADESEDTNWGISPLLRRRGFWWRIVAIIIIIHLFKCFIFIFWSKRNCNLLLLLYCWKMLLFYFAILDSKLLLNYFTRFGGIYSTILTLSQRWRCHLLFRSFIYEGAWSYYA